MSRAKTFLAFGLLSVIIQLVFAHSRQFHFFRVNKNAYSWQRIKNMRCSFKMPENGVKRLRDCILQCLYDEASVMAGVNETHCALCYYQLDGATLIASTFQGNFFFKRGKLASVNMC